jgi:hypothetical protein
MTRLGVAKATIPSKATLNLSVSAGEDVLHADSTPSVVSSSSV